MSFPLLKYRAAKIAARSGMSHHQRHIEGEKDLRFWTNFGIVVAILIGVVVITTHGGIRTAGIAALGAALGTGGVLGFLFGVPSPSKSPVTNINSGGPVTVSAGAGSQATNDAPPAAQAVPAAQNPGANGAPAAQQGVPAPALPAQQAPAAIVNHPPAAVNAHPVAPQPVPPAPAQPTGYTTPPGVSNLEQVADWVTKLLLGGGLTQMQRIPPTVWRWSHIVAIGIIGDHVVSEQAMAAQQAFASGLLVYGFILGFFAGYLITKLQLGKAICD